MDKPFCVRAAGHSEPLLDVPSFMQSFAGVYFEREMVLFEVLLVQNRWLDLRHECDACGFVEAPGADGAARRYISKADFSSALKRLVDRGKIKDVERVAVIAKAEADGCFEAAGEMVGYIDYLNSFLMHYIEDEAPPTAGPVQRSARFRCWRHVVVVAAVAERVGPPRSASTTRSFRSGRTAPRCLSGTAPRSRTSSSRTSASMSSPSPSARTRCGAPTPSPAASLHCTNAANSPPSPLTPSEARRFCAGARTPPPGGRLACADAYEGDSPRPSPRTNRTRRVPHPVLTGRATGCRWSI